MSLAVIHSRALLGIQAPLVVVEVHLSHGLPAFNIVGLPEVAVKESKDRVRSALINCQFEFPQQRITVNLAPADLPKEGGRFDLPIALGILAASNQLNLEHIDQYEFIGELALTGELRPVPGLLPSALACAEHQRQLIAPHANASEATLSPETTLVSPNLLQVCAHLQGTQSLAEASAPKCNTPIIDDIAEVVGQNIAKRALEVAAAGGHNLLLYGPPGTGKTMLASRLPGILPPMETKMAQELACIYSVNRHQQAHFNGQRPFRAPHHTASAVALVGGGSNPKPGEISLAHGGVLFLDELPEYPKHVLEVLREPLESGQIWISRAAQQVQFPAQFQLVAAMNPCPCGYLGDAQKSCRCSTEQIQRYRQKLSGPLLDRIDMHIPVPPIPAEVLLKQNTTPSENSATVRQRVEAAYERQLARQGFRNHLLANKNLEEHCQLNPENQTYLLNAVNTLGFSNRALHRILRCARTIADLDNSSCIEQKHLREALSYRTLDRQR